MLRSTCFALIGATLFMASAARGQEWARKMFETSNHDFGVVARGAKVDYEFVLTNIYQEDVHIVGVRSSCGCASPTVSQPLLKTYEKGSIVATLNTRTFLGDRSATITVTLDRPYPAEVQLQIKGYIRSDVVLHPGMVEFGAVKQGESAEKVIDIQYAGRNDWRVTAVKTLSPFLEAEVVETGRGGGQVAYQLVCRLKEGAPPGYLNEHLVLETNDRRAREVPVAVEGRIASPVTISPASLFMGNVAPRQTVTKQLVIRADKPFRILAVECDDDCFAFKTADEPKPLHLIPVTFTAGDKAGKVAERIRVATDLGEDITTEFLAYAQVVDAPN